MSHYKESVQNMSFKFNKINEIPRLRFVIELPELLEDSLQQRWRQLKIKIVKSASLQMNLLNDGFSFAYCIKGLHSISFNHWNYSPDLF